MFDEERDEFDREAYGLGEYRKGDSEKATGSTASWPESVPARAWNLEYETSSHYEPEDGPPTIPVLIRPYRVRHGEDGQCLCGWPLDEGYQAWAVWHVSDPWPEEPLEAGYCSPQCARITFPPAKGKP